MIKLNQRERLGSQIYRQLHKAILTLELLPGQSLSENEIAEKIGVSRQPVREAFIKLAEAGLVKILPQRGTYVRNISRRAVKEVRFIREALEVAAAKEAIARPDQDKLDELQDLIDQLTAVSQEDNWHEFIRIDDLFHKTISEFSGAELVWRIVEREKAPLDRVRYLSFPMNYPMTRLIRQHQAILDAIRDRDRERAEAAIREHHSEVLLHLPILAEKHPDLFTEND